MSVDHKVDGIRHIFFTQGVKRWHTLELSAPQSLADHHWAVAMLLKAICPDVPHPIAEWAMVHDMDELVSGDIPGHFKAHMDEKAREALDEEILKLMPNWWKRLKWQAHLEKHKIYVLLLKACDVADQARVARRIVGSTMRSKASTALDIRLGETIDKIGSALSTNQPVELHPEWIRILSAYRTES